MSAPPFPDPRAHRPTACCDFHNCPEDIEAHLARWAAEYGKTRASVPLPSPPAGWVLMPFGAEVPSLHREFIEGAGWAAPRRCRSTVTPMFARPAGPVRAYAEQVNTK